VEICVSSKGVLEKAGVTAFAGLLKSLLNNINSFRGAIRERQRPDWEGASVQAEKARLLYRNAPMAFLTLLFGATALMWVFKGEVGYHLVTQWYWALVLFMCVRMATWHWYHRYPDMYRPSGWLRLFTAGSMLTGAIWGVTIMLMHEQYGVQLYEFVVFLLAGVTTAMIATSSSHLPACLGFVIPALGPLAFHFFYTGFYAMGLAVLIYGAVICRLGQALERKIIEEFHLAKRNAGLVRSLGRMVDKLRASEERYRLVVDHSPIGIAQVAPDGTALYVNPHLRAILDVREKDAIDQLPFPISDRSGDTVDEAEHVIIGRRSGDARHVLVRTLPMNDLEGQAKSYIATVLDVTEHRRSAAVIHHMAHHDSLTGLPNRFSFREHLTNVIKTSNEHHQKMAVVLIDLDHFKDVNDTLGHPIGDKLLQVVTDRLRSCVRQTDLVARLYIENENQDHEIVADTTVARLGGDEFAIIASDISDADGLANLAQRILTEFERPFQVDGKEISTSASIGIAIYPGDSHTADGLVRDADLALYKAKREGRNTFALYDSGMHADITTRRQIESDLRHALPRGELSLHYQPQIELKTGRVIGIEALMRWQHPVRGFIPPLEFIPVAEQIHLIEPLTAWLLKEACTQTRTWDEGGLLRDEFSLSVNISPLHLRSADVIKLIDGTLKEIGLPPNRLDIEITEFSVLQGDKVWPTLTKLEKLGVGLSVDDFGTGYSSLTYLKSFPVHRLKIDKSFVMDLCTSRDSESIVRAIIGLGKSLDIRVIAEGVETENAAQMLLDIGCDEAQGFYFAAPMSVPDFERWCETCRFAASRWQARRAGSMA
jgi:PAS domain S-box-containing protein